MYFLTSREPKSCVESSELILNLISKRVQLRDDLVAENPPRSILILLYRYPSKSFPAPCDSCPHQSQSNVRRRKITAKSLKPSHTMVLQLHAPLHLLYKGYYATIELLGIVFDPV